MPRLARLREKYRDRGLKILGVFVDHEFAKAEKMLASHGYDWPHLVDRSLTTKTYLEHPVAKKYAVGGFPTLWIIDREGVLRQETSTETLEKDLSKYLGDGERK